MSYAARHLDEARDILARLDTDDVEDLAAGLAGVKAAGGRLFFVGVGGSAANCSHAVNDFRKLAGIESYAPTDNVSELTARINDEGWDTTFVEWLKISRLGAPDALFVLSVGGGDEKRNVSTNLVAAVRHAKSIGAKVFGVLGRDGGYTARFADACVVVPTVNVATVTPHAESFQAVIWHLLVSHPLLNAAAPKWESLEA
ncbi:MAG TPA: SIS domain-containing protein [Steroidobacteraceae bacterium]|nr:SIS domain-containing protein [Steroidobacteraceae bacterium]